MTHFHDWPPAMRSLSCAALVALLGLALAGPLSAQQETEGDAEVIADVAAAGETTDGAADAEAEAAVATAADAMSQLATLRGDADTLWICLAAFLVFFMQAGFALVECGFTRAKNACNIIMKNMMDFALGSLVFWLVGFGLMFGVSAYGGLIGSTFFVFDPTAQADAIAAMDKTEGFSWAFLIFQTVFCATAATIVSGAMAERTKFAGYLIYTVLITAIVYPIFGHWAWGNLWAGEAWLAKAGFIDFAGSTVVHSVGGWCALAGAIVVGARVGKFSKDGKPQPIPGHNIPMAALGVFILWLGWFGFNPGSTTMLGSGEFARVAVTTNLAGASGALTAMIASWVAFKKPDPSFTFNGALAGLVAITAGCFNMTPLFAAVTGAAAGVIVVFSCVLIDRIRIDDPVGAVSVHAVCGAFGTLAVGLWGVNYAETGIVGIGLVNGGGTAQLLTQAMGVGAAFAWAFPVSLGIFLAIKYTVGLRVSEKEELEGLDIHEHGMLAYPPHLVTDTFGGHPIHAPASPGMSPAGSPAVVHSSVPSTEGA